MDGNVPDTGIMHSRLVNCLLIILDLIDVTSKNPPEYIEEPLFKALQTVRCFIFTMLISLLANPEAFVLSGMSDYIQQRVNELRHLPIYEQVKKVFLHSITCLCNHSGDNKEEFALTSIITSLSIIETNKDKVTRAEDEQADKSSKFSENSTGIMISDKDDDEKPVHENNTTKVIESVNVEENATHDNQSDKDSVHNLSQLFKEKAQVNSSQANKQIPNSKLDPEHDKEKHDNDKVKKWVSKHERFANKQPIKKSQYKFTWKSGNAPIRPKFSTHPPFNPFKYACSTQFQRNGLGIHPLQPSYLSMRPSMHFMQRNAWENRCRYCKKFQHTVDSCPKLLEKFCEVCKKNGHSSDYCKEDKTNRKNWRS